jgi:hypothetical protein
MALSWVKVVRRDGSGVGDPVYIDGNYVDAAGFIGTPLKTDTGAHRFETLAAGYKPNWRKDQTVENLPGNSEQNPQDVTLDPVAAAVAGGGSGGTG